MEYLDILKDITFYLKLNKVLYLISMLYSNIMVMSFPFITTIEKNERQKKINAISIEKINTKTGNHSKNDIKSPESTIKPTSDQYSETHDMICLSNLEEVVFYTSTSRCLLKELRCFSKSTPVDYDKYLDFFE